MLEVSIIKDATSKGLDIFMSISKKRFIGVLYHHILINIEIFSLQLLLVLYVIPSLMS